MGVHLTWQARATAGTRRTSLLFLFRLFHQSENRFSHQLQPGSRVRRWRGRWLGLGRCRRRAILRRRRGRPAGPSQRGGQHKRQRHGQQRNGGGKFAVGQHNALAPLDGQGGRDVVILPRATAGCKARLRRGGVSFQAVCLYLGPVSNAPLTRQPEPRALVPLADGLTLPAGRRKRGPQVPQKSDRRYPYEAGAVGCAEYESLLDMNVARP